MKIKIKHWINENIILCGEYESIKECIEKNAKKDLSGADLSGADLRGAYLSGEKLTKEPLMLSGLKYFVLIAVEKIHIGCEVHKAEEWAKFKDETISKMDRGALGWWKIWKPSIMALHAEHAK